MTHAQQVMSVAKMEDTYDFLNHIGWTDTIKPELDRQVRIHSQMLVNDALGVPLPQGLTREKVAGICYGITWMSNFLEKVTKEGQKALDDLRASGFTL